MIPSYTHSQNHSLVVAVKKNLSKVTSHHSLSTASVNPINDALHSSYARIWKLIQTPTSLDDIYQACSMQPDTDTDNLIAEQDILSLIQTLARLGLIDICIEINET